MVDQDKRVKVKLSLTSRGDSEGGWNAGFLSIL